jgi:hypothetical protein
VFTYVVDILGVSDIMFDIEADCVIKEPVDSVVRRLLSVMLFAIILDENLLAEASRKEAASIIISGPHLIKTFSRLTLLTWLKLGA